MAQATVGGLISALLFLSIVGGGFGALFLGYLAPLPLFLVGLGLGVRPVLVAAAVAGSASALAGPLPLSVAMLGLVLVPVLVTVRQSLLSRHTNDGNGIEWYPPGLALVWLTGVAVGLVVLVTIPLLGQPDGPATAIQAILAKSLSEMAKLAGPETMPEPEAIQSLATTLAWIFPGMVAAIWVVATVINGALAQAVLMRLGRNLRPPMRMDQIVLPSWVAMALAGFGMLALVTDGAIGFLAANAAMLLGMLFLFVGLGVLHAVIARIGGGKLMLGIAYAILVLFMWPLILTVGVGVIEQWVGLRRRLAAAGPDQEKV